MLDKWIALKDPNISSIEKGMLKPNQMIVIYIINFLSFLFLQCWWKISSDKKRKHC
jgi:hypothetical protein